MKALSRLGFYGLVLLALGLAGWRINIWLDRPPAIEVVDVSRGNVTRLLALTGRLRPALRNQLSFVVGGRVVELVREEGSDVTAGEVVARLDSRQAAAVLEGAEADLARSKEELEQTRRDFIRDDNLTAGGLVPERTLEASRLAVDSAEKEVDARREAVAESAARLEDFILRSPLSGVVLERPVDPGQVVAAQQLVYEVATWVSAQVEVEVDERFLGAVSLGQKARVAVPGSTLQPLQAVVAFIGNRIDRSSGAVIVRLDFVDPPPRLPADLTLDVNIVVEVHQGALSLPREAVAGIGSQTWVLEVKGDRLIRSSIDAIDWPAPRIVILGGLEEGAQVALTPRQLDPGVEVRLVSDQENR